MNTNTVLSETCSNIIELGIANGHQPAPTGTGVRTTSPTASRPTEYFTHRGRQWRMFKRRALSASEVAQHSPGPPWQLYFEAKGRRHLWSLKFADKRSATAEAKLKLDLYYDGREEDLRKVLADRRVDSKARVVRHLNEFGHHPAVAATPKAARRLVIY